MATNEEILGRADVNDIEAILSITNTDVDEVIHAVKDNAEAIFTWDYEKGQRPALNKLYEKAKTSQWNGETDLDWSIDVDVEKLVQMNPAQERTDAIMAEAASRNLPFAKWDEKRWLDFRIESQNWTLSQFMHGEQGALLCTAKIV